MKALYSLLMTAVIVVPAAGIAAVGDQTVAPAAEAICRQVTTTTDGIRKEQNYCGTAAQWAEFDRRTSLMNAGVTCRNARTEQELCMTAQEWQKYDHRRSDLANPGGQFNYDRAASATNINNSWSIGTGSQTDMLMYSRNH
ncbi:MAG TPA: hypothetical protein VMH83_05225 [Candidatus Acidoferrum sp.]|nr:hypothetical protein [Candidatus Acidoferrum sp.]